MVHSTDFFLLKNLFIRILFIKNYLSEMLIWWKIECVCCDHLSGYKKFLHMPWQLCCHGMCKNCSDNLIIIWMQNNFCIKFWLWWKKCPIQESKARQCLFHKIHHIEGLVQHCSISSVLAREILQSCTKRSLYTYHHVNGLVQERCNSIALAMELHLSCTNPLIYWPIC